MSNDDDKDKIFREMAGHMKKGWEQARRDGVVSPELAKALVEQGVHPERVEHYMEALMTSRKGKGQAPKIEDFAEPVVIPFKKDEPKPSNG